jgi:acyl-homoserine-lactone acylase
MRNTRTARITSSARTVSPTLAALAVLAILAVSAAPAWAQAPTRAEVARWEAQAQRVTITRDDWGIAHVKGPTDADAVFGMVYAQAEDDYPRIQANYAFALGRQALAQGEDAIWADLRARMYADPDSLKAEYRRSPKWLKALMDAFADGLNYYLYTHPNADRMAIQRYEPWMALSFTEGSIGGDIERIDLRTLAEFYGDDDRRATGSPLAAAGFSAYPPDDEPRGSNGFAIAPENTQNGRALLFINPHTSFYFRSELQMTSDEGLDAYGAVTWGQFFIYQGFNRTSGWMHTSSGVDNIDWFLETPVNRGGRMYYRYGGRELPMATRDVTIEYRTANGATAERTFTVYFTRHGPIVGRQGDAWLSVSLMWEPVEALTQSYTRTKAHNLGEYLDIMELHTNSSNNTIYADAEGNIAHLHSNYIPRRDPSFDWTRPVDGSDPRTDYDGVLSIEETPNAINPGVGWVYNSNNWPWSAAGPDSPRRADFPTYVETGRYETARGLHALKLLPDHPPFTMSSLTDLAYDSYLPAFEIMLPALIRAYDALPPSDPLHVRLAGPVHSLRGWDYRWGVNSVPTSLAVFWGEEVRRSAFQEMRSTGAALDAEPLSTEQFVATRLAPATLLAALSSAVDRLTADFGSWQTPWGHINRFQRISADIEPHFDDSEFSIPVPFTSSRWGSLASFGARAYPNTKRWYGTSGNSFVAVVEFGDSVRARALTAGGESGHPGSPHFNDQAAIYAMGHLRDVYFYASQLEGHTERTYHPGG